MPDEPGPAPRENEVSITIKGVPNGIHIKVNADWILTESAGAAEKISGIAKILRDLAMRIEKGQ